MSLSSFQTLRPELTKPVEECGEFISSSITYQLLAKNAAVDIEKQLASPNLSEQEKSKLEQLKKQLEEAAKVFIGGELTASAVRETMQDLYRTNDALSDRTAPELFDKIKAKAKVPTTQTEWQKNAKFTEYSRAVWKIKNPNKPLPWEDEEDIVLGDVERSVLCPLTGGVMEVPYKNTACGHSYEKEYIFNFVKQGAKACPQAGCNKQVSKQSLVHDIELETYIKEKKKQEELDKKAKSSGVLDLGDDDDVTFD